MAKSMLHRLARLAWPVLVAQVAIVANGVIDTVMAGRLSAIDLAAVGIGTSIHITVFVPCMGVLLALTPTVARDYGAGRFAGIGEDVRQSVWLALILAALGMYLLRHPEPFLWLSDLPPETDFRVRAYLDAISWSMIPGLLFRVFYGFMSGIARPRTIMVCNLIGLALKIPLNSLFMMGWGMGAAGCGASTTVIAWGTALLAWGWLAGRDDCRRYGIFARFSWPRAALILQLSRLGIPIGVTLFVDVTAFAFMALFVARLGAVVSAAHQIAANLAIMAFMAPLSIGQAALVLAGHALGGNDSRGARRASLVGLGTGMICAAITSLILWRAAVPLASLYTPDEAVRELAASLIVITAAYHLADALQAIVVNILRAYKRTTIPMVIYAISLWGVGLGGGYVLGLTGLSGAAHGVAGFWWAAAMGVLLAGAVVLIYFLRVARDACQSAQ